MLIYCMFRKLIDSNRYILLASTPVLGAILMTSIISWNFKAFLLICFAMNLCFFNFVLMKKEKPFPDYDYILYENGKKDINFFVVDILSLVCWIGFSWLVDMLFFSFLSFEYILFKTAAFSCIIFCYEGKVKEIRQSVREPKIQRRITEDIKLLLLPVSIERNYVRSVFLGKSSLKK